MKIASNSEQKTQKAQKDKKKNWFLKRIGRKYRLV